MAHAVFISWSGRKAEAVGGGLKRWLAELFEQDIAWMSKQDIDVGMRSHPEMDRALEGIDFGIICCTCVSVASPWVLFEAGAIAKDAARSRPYVYLIDGAGESSKASATIPDRGEHPQEGRGSNLHIPHSCAPGVLCGFGEREGGCPQWEESTWQASGRHRLLAVRFERSGCRCSSRKPSRHSQRHPVPLDVLVERHFSIWETTPTGAGCM